MKNFFKTRLALLTLLIGFLGYLVSLILVKYSVDEIYLHLFAGIFILNIIYFFCVSLSIIRHRWHNAVLLLLGTIILRISLNDGKFDLLFFIGIIGFLLGYLILSITYIEKINRWLLKPLI